MRTPSESVRARRGAPLPVGDKPTLAPAVRWVINLRTNKSGLVAAAFGLNIGQRAQKTCARPGLPGKPWRESAALASRRQRMALPDSLLSFFPPLQILASSLLQP